MASAGRRVRCHRESWSGRSGANASTRPIHGSIPFGGSTSMSPARAPRSPDLRYLRDLLAAKDPKFLEMLEEEQLNAEIAQTIYDLRTAAGLTQSQLAKKIGTHAPVICRLED